MPGRYLSAAAKEAVRKGHMAREKTTFTPDEAAELVVTDLTNYVEVESTRTEVLRNLAKHIVFLRKAHQHDGMPDWAGRSQEYRTIVATCYEKAGIPPDSQRNVQAAVRYHIQTALRTYAPADDLTKLKLDPRPPSERNATPSGARVTVPNVKVTDDAREIAVHAAEAISNEDPVPTIQEALRMIKTAQTFKLPDSDQQRELLHTLCQQITAEAIAFAQTVQTIKV